MTELEINTSLYRGAIRNIASRDRLATTSARAGSGPGRRPWKRDGLLVGIECSIVTAEGCVDRALGRSFGLGWGRVLDPRVINADDHIGERLLDQLQVMKGQLAVVQLAVPNEPLDHSVDMLADALRTPVLQGPGRGFDRVGHHDDRRLLALGAGPRVSEVILADVEPLLKRLAVEILLDRRPLVLLDDVLDRRGEVVLVEQLERLP